MSFKIDRNPSTENKKSQGHFKKKDLLERSVIDYYLRIKESLSDNSIESDEKASLIENVLEQVLQEITKVSKSQTVSPIIEQIIPHADKRYTEELLQAFLNDFEAMITHRSASYVFQALLYRCSYFLSNVNEDDKIVQSLTRMCFLLLEQPELLGDRYASHVIRTNFEVMSGVTVPCRIVRGHSNQQRNEKTKQVCAHDAYAQFKDTIPSLASSIVKFDLDIINLQLLDPSMCPLFITIFLILHEKDPEQFTRYCTELYKIGFFSIDGELSSAYTDQTASFFTSEMIPLLSNELFSDLLQNTIIPNLETLLQHPRANYCVKACFNQKLSTEKFDLLLSAITPHIEMLVKSKRAIILEMVTLAVKHDTKQNAVLKLLRSGYNVSNGQLTESILYSTYDKRPRYIESNILQQLLQFSDNKPIRNGFINMKSEQHAKLCCSSIGSFIYDVFLKLTTVEKREKNQLCDKFQGHWTSLAKDKFGSRILDLFWDLAVIPIKTKIGTELAANVQHLYGSGSLSAKIIANKLELNKCRHNRKEWNEWLIQQKNKNVVKPQKRKMVEETVNAETKKTRKTKTDDADLDDAAKRETVVTKLKKPGTESTGDFEKKEVKKKEAHKSELIETTLADDNKLKKMEVKQTEDTEPKKNQEETKTISAE